MKNLTSAVLMLLISFTVVSQEKQIELEYQFRLGQQEVAPLKLVGNGNQCLSTITSIRSFAPGIKVLEDGSLEELEGETRYETTYKYTFKDYISNTLICYDEINSKPYYIKESGLNLFEWSIHKETQEILGYSCLKASACFRGRTYIAWFTTDLPFKAAPWKFHGLPGVILKVESDDMYLEMTARQIDIVASEGDIDNPYSNEKLTSWETYVNKYKSIRKQEDDKLKAMFAKRGVPMPEFHLSKAEVIVEANRKY